jgi:hypothetical protein
MSDYEDFFTNYDPGYKEVFHASWQDYEENGWIFIFEKGDEYFYIEGGYCVFGAGEDQRPDFSHKYKITFEKAFEKMEEWKDCIGGAFYG